MAQYNFVAGTKWLQILEDQLPLDIPNILGQRYCDPKEVRYALRGGYDKGLFRPVFCIAVPKKVAREWVEQLPKKDQAKYDGSFAHGIDKLNNYALFVFDGKHRAEHLRLISYHKATFPFACVYFVNTVEKGNDLFNQFNELSLTKVNNEQIFINQYLAKDIKVLNLVKRLEEVNVAVCDKKDFFVVPEDAKNDKTIPSINSNSFKLLNNKDWHPDWKDVKSAFSIYHEMMQNSKRYASELKETETKPNELKRRDVNAWLISGLAMLFRHRPNILLKPQPREAFVLSLAEAFDMWHGKLNQMMKMIRREAISTPSEGGLNAQAEELNTSQVWAVVLAQLLNLHGYKHGVKKGECQSATKLKTLWKDIEVDVDARKKAKRKAKLRVA
jgi:hypothetical protein